jgi:RimJ/RimL family protein N-acetyltransferase
MPIEPTLTDGVATLHASPRDQGWEWEVTAVDGGRYAGRVTLRDRGSGRAEIEVAPAGEEDGTLEHALRLVLDRAFAAHGLQTVAWWVRAGDWGLRRLAWRLGFSHDGVLRDWQPHDGGLVDGWVGTLLHDDPREPRTPWLDNPVVEGDGVRLRPFNEADVPRIVEGVGDPDTQYWLAFLPRDPGAAEARAYIEQVTDRLATNHTITWAVCTPEDDTLLGAVGIYRVAVEPEVGYWTHPEARGRGITTRAAGLAIRHAFEALGLERLAGYASAANLASQRVLEVNGMRRTGVHRQAARTGDGSPADLVGYDLLASEYAAAPSPRRWTDADHSSTATPTTDSAPPTSAGAR